MPVTYSDLLFLIGQVQTTCADVWPAEFGGWGAIVLADYLRGFIHVTELLDMYSFMDDKYQGLGMCIVQMAQ